MNTQNNISLKEESLRWIFSITGAVFIYAIVACIVHAVYHPDIDRLLSVANEILTEPKGARPEPVEALLFRLGVVIIIPGIVAFYKLFLKLSLPRFLTGRPFYLIFSSVCIAVTVALIWFDFAALNPFGPDAGDVVQNNRDKVSSTNFDFYFGGIFLGSYLWLYAFIVVPLIACLFFIGLKKKNWENNKLFRIASSAIGYVFLVGCVVTLVLINTTHFPYSNENKYDFGAVYYSMTQVYAGVPMLVDHFTNTYGLYPHFLNPLFQLIGLSVFNFTLVLSLLTALCFILNFFFLKQFVHNKIILFLGFTSVLFFPYIDFLITTNFDSLFSCYPIRYIIPSSLTCLAAMYLKRPRQMVYWLTSFVSAFFILWNPEMGLVCYCSWLAVNIYNDFYQANGTVAIKRILFHLLASAGVVTLAFCIYGSLIFLFYGSWPAFGSLFNTIFVFGKVGLSMLPMVLVHPWNLMVIILVIGFAYAIVPWCKKKVTPKSSVVLFVTFIALGYFLYFQGRSQDSNFEYSSGFCLILLTILGDELWQTVRTTNTFLLNALFVVFLFLVSFSFVEIIFNTPKMASLVYQ